MSKIILEDELIHILQGCGYKCTKHKDDVVVYSSEILKIIFSHDQRYNEHILYFYPSFDSPIRFFTIADFSLFIDHPQKDVLNSATGLKTYFKIASKVLKDDNYSILRDISRLHQVIEFKYARSEELWQKQLLLDAEKKS